MKLSYKEKIIYVDLFKKYTQVYIYIKLYFYSLVFTPKNKNRFIKQTGTEIKSILWWLVRFVEPN